MLLSVLYIIGITAEGITGALAAGREKMDIFGVKLEEPQFCRCHRAFMFNIYYLEKFSKNEIKLSDGVIIPVSKNRQQKVINCVDSFYDC